MKSALKKQWDENPLPLILIIAGIFRLLAAIFSKGFGMHDDHFLVIELAQRWLDGYNDWFTEGYVIRRSLVYPGLHYLLFYALEQTGITDPQAKMYVVRFLHAIFSMITVYFGYLISLRITGRKTAGQIGLLLAIFWIFPFMSVHNLMEFACIPFLMLAFYFIIKFEETPKYKYWFWAGFMFALAFTIRFQTGLFVAGLGLVLLYRRQWKSIGWLSLGIFASTFITMGLAEWIAFGTPYAYIYHSLLFYIGTVEKPDVPGPWYRYLLFTLGVFIPPVSLMLAYGFLRTWRKLAIIFWPVFVFFVAHSYHPNKQERYVLTIFPFFIMLGLAGWNEYVKDSQFWKRHRRWLKGSWIWFWSINTILVVVLTFTYSKKNRVETLYYLSHKTHIDGVIWESHLKGTPFVPKFYLNKKIPVYDYPASKPPEQLQADIARYGLPFPDYIIFLGEKNIRQRIETFEANFSKKLIFEKRIEPSLVDDVVHKLNPRRNVNQVSYVYRIEPRPRPSP